MHLRPGIPVSLTGWLCLVIGSKIATASSYGASAGTATESQGGLDAAIVGVLITLIVGGFVLWLGRSYAESVTGKARSEPGRSFLVGFLSLLCVLGLAVLGYANGIFLLVALPVVFAYALVVLFGAVMGELAIGRGLTDWWVSALIVAVIVAAFVAGVPILGGLVGFVVTSIGTGAVINHARDGDGSRRFPGTYPPTGTPRDW